MHFQITLTLLNGTYHGRSDNGETEWPPSPLRLFQALMGVSKRAGIECDAALDWLAALPPPTIFAPRIKIGQAYQTSVPNNAMDIVARAWSRGASTSKDAQPSTHKAMKTIRTAYLLKEVEVEESTEVLKLPSTALTSCEAERRVTFSWAVEDVKEAQEYIGQIRSVARCLYCIGWGLDLVAGHSETVDAPPVDSRIRWAPEPRGGRIALRAPKRQTRRLLEEKHNRFLNRLADETLQSVPSLSSAAFESIGYSTEEDHSPFPFAAFSLLKADGSGFQAYRKTTGCEVAGMARHCVRTAAENSGWPEDEIARFVLGHGERKGNRHQPVGSVRFGYVPLPSIEKRDKNGPPNHLGMIRRLLLFSPDRGAVAKLLWARQTLSGQVFKPERNQEPALVSVLPDSDPTIQRYINGPGRSAVGATTWTTVTPVILPGHDDKRGSKTEGLLRKAIVQAGFSQSLADNAALDWTKSSFVPGAEHAQRYFVPKHLKDYPRYHVRITWRNSAGIPIPVAGPIVIGGGRYFGTGLFVGAPT